MTKKSGDLQATNRILSSWDEIAECLGGFPAPKAAIDYDYEAGEIDDKTSWVFRGLKSSFYGLQPTIERDARSTNWEWPALEKHVSNEFKARARMHLNASLIPDDELAWLAMRQLAADSAGEKIRNFCMAGHRLDLACLRIRPERV